MRAANPWNTKVENKMRIDGQLARWGERERMREQKSLKTVYWSALGSF